MFSDQNIKKLPRKRTQASRDPTLKSSVLPPECGKPHGLCNHSFISEMGAVRCLVASDVLS